MAVDTRDKRSSVINLDMYGRVFPNPDGSLVNANDRIHVGAKYAGITGASSGVAKKIPWHLFFRRVI